MVELLHFDSSDREMCILVPEQREREKGLIFLRKKSFDKTRQIVPPSFSSIHEALSTLSVVWYKAQVNKYCTMSFLLAHLTEPIMLP